MYVDSFSLLFPFPFHVVDVAEKKNALRAQAKYLSVRLTSCLHYNRSLLDVSDSQCITISLIPLHLLLLLLSTLLLLLNKLPLLLLRTLG